MDHILSYSIYESSEQYIADYIEDIFFEFSDDKEWTVFINKDVEIHQRNTPKVLYGNGFITTSEMTPLLRKEVTKKYQDWKLGFLVTMHCSDPSYERRSSSHDSGPRKLRGPERRKWEQDKNTKNTEKIKIINFIRKKIRLIKRRCPKGVTLYGVIQVEKGFDDRNLTFKFAFIYDEFK